MRAHVAPGSWSRVVSLLHQRRSSFLTRTEIGNRNEVNNQLLSYQTLQTWLSNLPHHRQALVILTFRKDINRSMPSLSNLEGGGGAQQKKRQVSRGGGDVHRCWPVLRKETHSTIPQDFLTGSDTVHTLLTKQSKTNIFQSKGQKPKHTGSSYTCAWLETFAHFHLRLSNGCLWERW